MSTTQLTAPRGRLGNPIVAALVVAAFAIGGLTGIGLARVAAATASHSDGTARSAIQAPSIPGAAVNNMSDAAARALYGTSTIAGAAVNNMSDAAARALYGTSTIPGAAVNNMSDAAAKAVYGSAAIPGAAVNNMSDAAARALYGTSTAAHQAFHLEKACDTATHCVVTVSTFKAIPAGTEITYSGSDANHLTAVITIKNGTAIGQCAIGSLVGFGDPSLPATCTFDTGTGRLTQFHLSVTVTTTAQHNPWFWDGTYWFGGGR